MKSLSIFLFFVILGLGQDGPMAEVVLSGLGYPAEAREQGVIGRVRLHYEIRGGLGQGKPVSGNPMLAKEALANLEKWIPLTQNHSVDVEYEFILIKPGTIKQPVKIKPGWRRKITRPFGPTEKLVDTCFNDPFFDLEPRWKGTKRIGKDGVLITIEVKDEKPCSKPAARSPT